MPKTYKLHHGPATITYDKGCDGYCLMPDREGEQDNSIEIWIQSGLRGRKKLETLIHELLHAEHPDMSEEDVTRTGANIMAVLWGEGYRHRGELKR